MKQFAVENKTISLYPGRAKNSPIVYLNTCAGEGGQVYQALQDNGCRDVALAAIDGLDWHHDMAPWEASPVFKKDIPCTAGADDYLQILTGQIVPEVEGKLSEPVLWRGLAGYSLAGLFALYAPYRTELFSRIASVSGSLWFPGFQEYVFSHEMRREPDCLYLSLGDRECRTKHPCLKNVQERTEQIAAFYRKRNLNTVLQMNPGNHFQDSVERTAAGIAWLAEAKGKDI